MILLLDSMMFEILSKSKRKQLVYTFAKFKSRKVKFNKQILKQLI